MVEQYCITVTMQLEVERWIACGDMTVSKQLMEMNDCRNLFKVAPMMHNNIKLEKQELTIFDPYKSCDEGRKPL